MTWFERIMSCIQLNKGFMQKTQYIFIENVRAPQIANTCITYS